MMDIKNPLQITNTSKMTIKIKRLLKSVIWLVIIILYYLNLD